MGRCVFIEDIVHIFVSCVVMVFKHRFGSNISSEDRPQTLCGSLVLVLLIYINLLIPFIAISRAVKLSSFSTIHCSNEQAPDGELARMAMAEIELSFSTATALLC